MRGGARGAVNNNKVKYVFFFSDTATTEIYTLSLHDALPIWIGRAGANLEQGHGEPVERQRLHTGDNIRRIKRDVLRHIRVAAVLCRDRHRGAQRDRPHVDKCESRVDRDVAVQRQNPAARQRQRVNIHRIERDGARRITNQSQGDVAGHRRQRNGGVVPAGVVDRRTRRQRDRRNVEISRASCRERV